MSDQTSEDQDKIDEYLHVIEKRILAPIRKTEVQQSCTATLLLLFAAIDGLGILLHVESKARPGKRILGFLDYMGGDYRVHKKELLGLRNSLVHNAINVESFLSKTEMGADQHLTKMGADDFIHVNTMVMYKDFVDVLTKFRAEIKQDPAMMKRAADRLEWRETADRVEWCETNLSDYLDVASPTLPPPVRFIHAKKSQSASD